MNFELELEIVAAGRPYAKNGKHKSSAVTKL